MPADFDHISDLVKSGPRRLKDACELMELPTRDRERSDADTRHLRGAMYLAGYGVECLLKAYLTEQIGCQRLSEAEDKINQRLRKAGKEPIRSIAASAAGHSIEYLLRLTDLEARPGYDRHLWGRIAGWRSVWRYDPAPVSRQRAEEFLQDVLDAVNWLSPKVARS